MVRYYENMGVIQTLAKEIRFAVGRGSDLRSSVWRLWANKNDLFLAARSMAGLSKFSFHASGVWRYAVVSQVPRPALGRWTRPRPSIEGISTAVDIIVPDFQVPNAFLDEMPPAQKKLELIEGPAKGTKQIIRIFLAGKDFTEADALSVPRSAPISFYGQVPLLREVAWLVSYSDLQKPEEREYLDRLASTTRISLTPGSSPDGMKVQMHILEGSVYPTLIDVQLGPGNIFVDEQ